MPSFSTILRWIGIVDGVALAGVTAFATQVPSAAATCHTVVMCLGVISTLLSGLSAVSTPATASKVTTVLLFTLGLFGCGAAALLATAPAQVADIVALEKCIQANWGQSFATVEATCAPNEEQLVADAILDVIDLADEVDAGDAGAVVNPYASEPAVVAAMTRRQIKLQSRGPHALNASPVFSTETAWATR